MVWEDLKSLKLKTELKPVLSSVMQKLLHTRGENTFILYHLHKPLNSFSLIQETPEQR